MIQRSHPEFAITMYFPIPESPTALLIQRSSATIRSIRAIRSVRELLFRVAVRGVRSRGDEWYIGLCGKGFRIALVMV